MTQARAICAGVHDFAEATDTYRSALLLLGFVLFIVTFVVLAIARLMLMQLQRREGLQ